MALSGDSFVEPSGVPIPLGPPQGYVGIDEDTVRSLPSDHFDTNQASEEEDTTEVSAFRFERSARKSLMLKMGLGKNMQRALSRSMSKNENRGLSSIDVYSKCSEQESVNIYMANLLGMGVFQLARAMAKCGLIPGILAMVAFSFLHVFLCHRLVEVPSMVEESFELYAGIARATLPSAFYFPLAFSCMLTWYMSCVFYERQFLVSVVMFLKPGEVHPGHELHEWSWWIAKLILVLLLIPVSWRLNVNLVSRCSKWSLRSMFGVAAFEILGSMIYALTNGSEARSPPQLWGDQVIDGLQSMALCYIGIGMLPYIVAEMTQPHKATKMINTACMNIFAFYGVVAVVGYLCWGPDMLRCSRHPLSTMVALSRESKISGFRAFCYLLCGYAVAILFAFKTVASFPLYWWPLSREVEGFMAFEDSPATEIQLPWATKSQICERKKLKAVLVSITILPMFLSERGYEVLVGFALFGPVCVTHFVLPAWAAFAGIWKHWEAVQLRTARQLTMHQIEAGGLGWWAQTPSSKSRRYVGGSFAVHFWTALIACGFVCIFVLIIEFQWVCQNIFPADTRARLCPIFTNNSHVDFGKCLTHWSGKSARDPVFQDFKP